MSEKVSLFSTISLSQILDWVGGKWVNADRMNTRDSGAIRIVRPSKLDSARSDCIGFFFSKTYQNELPTCRAGILIVGQPFVQPLLASGLPLVSETAVVACDDPYGAMARVLEELAPKLSTVGVLPEADRSEKSWIHPSAVIHPSAHVGPAVRIDAGVVIESGAQVGSGTTLFAHVYLGASVQIGERCALMPGVKVYEKTQIGNDVRIHAGAVIGADGFGYAPLAQDNGRIEHRKIYHLGRVIIGDGAEIGANTCVDRGTIGDTIIGKNVKLDNLVQIGHNTTIGEGSVLCGSAAVAGSCTIGRFVYIGGLTGVANQAVIGDGAKVGAVSLVTKDVAPGETVVGNPMRTEKEHFRVHALLNKLLKSSRGRQGSRES